MRIERYYASLREEVSPLVEPAQELLNRQDYVGFFKACGPNYIRGIRRAQEVTAIFSFESTSTETSSQYASNVQVASRWWNVNYRSNYNNKSKFSSISNSLKITILGYGMGLTQKVTVNNMNKEGASETVESGGPTALDEIGSETLVATSLEEYNNVMKFAFNSMTKNKDSVHIGMVYGMEVVPWVENIAFQVESGLQDEAIEVPLPRSLIPRAYRRSNPSDKRFINDERDEFRCKELAYSIDRYGYCCEPDALYDYEEQEYDPEDPEVRICRPLRVLDKAIVTENMASNGEFVARLDRSVTFKVNQLSTMEKCISAARAIPERFDYSILKAQDTVKYDGAVDFNFTVFEMKMALDPFEDYSLLKHMARELDEFMDMYYQPCIAALFGTNVGRTSDTDPSYFMAYPWHTHDECTYLSCLSNSMRWDRQNGGCVPSLISGYNAAKYNEADDKLCTKDPDSGEVERCKYDSSELAEYHEKVTNGWRETIPLGRVDYFMEHFCMPQISADSISEQQECLLRAKYNTKVKDVEEMNVALKKPAKMSSRYPNGQASKANDGITNGRWRNGSVSHTKRDYQPWWEVNLQATFSINSVKVFNRRDCCSERLSNFILIIYNSGAEVKRYQHNGHPGYFEEVFFGGVVGDRVRIQLPVQEYLNFAELEVWAEPGSAALSSCLAPRYPVWPDDYKFVNDGNQPDGYECIKLSEQGSGWNNNYFCWRSGFADPQIRWSPRGPISNMKCTKIIEPSDPDTWNDNYLCVPNDSNLHFYWTNAARIEGRQCVQWEDSAEDPHTWHDNYLCAEQY